MPGLRVKSNSAAGLAAVVLTMCGGGVAWAQAAGGKDVGIRPDKEIVAEQYLLLGNANRGSGESQVAVNPLNPNEILVAGMSVMNSNEGQFQHDELEFQRTSRATFTQFAVSRDRGLTWSILEDPMRASLHRYRCLDPFAGFAIDGTMIAGCEAHFPDSLDPAQQIDAALYNSRANYGASAIITSVDGGRTWSEPVEVIGNPMPKAVFGPFVSFSPAGAWGDYPKLQVDASTGKLYISGQSAAAEPPHPQFTIRMSKDRGRNWGMVYAADSADWPSSSREASHAAANGVLAVAYAASQVPAELNAKCPCLVFGASKDDGKTFDRHLVPGAPGDGRGLVFADPSRPGRFAVILEVADHLQNYVTDDAGAHWGAAMSLGKIPDATGVVHMTGKYDAKGNLAISWRAMFHDPKAAPFKAAPRTGGAHVYNPDPDPFELWSALSHDGGKTFSAPLKISAGRSPGIPRRRGNANHGTEFTGVAIDPDFVHFSWFDARSGFLGTWYGRVPLTDYKFR